MLRMLLVLLMPFESATFMLSMLSMLSMLFMLLVLFILFILFILDGALSSSSSAFFATGFR